MTYWIATLLGTVCALTEFFPVSRTGHLAMMQNFLKIGNMEEHLLFSFLIQFAILAAIVVTYRADLNELFRQVRRGRGKDSAVKAQKQKATRKRLISFLTLGFVLYIPAFFLGTAAQSLTEKPMLVALMFALTGAALYISDRMGHGNKNVRSATLPDALSVGFAQLVSVLPGVSRSGATISAGLLCGFDRQFAVRFSMLLWIPAGLVVCLITLGRAIAEGIVWSYVPMYLVGMAVSFVIGVLAIYAVRLIAQRGRFGNFAFYCWGAGLLTMLLALIS